MGLRLCVGDEARSPTTVNGYIRHSLGFTSPAQATKNYTVYHINNLHEKLCKILSRLMRSLRARRKRVKKRNVHEHFEAVFNAAIRFLVSREENFRNLGINPGTARFVDTQ